MNLRQLRYLATGLHVANLLLITACLHRQFDAVDPLEKNTFKTSNEKLLTRVRTSELSGIICLCCIDLTTTTVALLHLICAKSLYVCTRGVHGIVIVVSSLTLDECFIVDSGLSQVRCSFDMFKELLF